MGRACHAAITAPGGSRWILGNRFSFLAAAPLVRREELLRQALAGAAVDDLSRLAVVFYFPDDLVDEGAHVVGLKLDNARAVGWVGREVSRIGLERRRDVAAHARRRERDRPDGLAACRELQGTIRRLTCLELCRQPRQRVRLELPHLERRARHPATRVHRRP